MTYFNSDRQGLRMQASMVIKRDMKPRRIQLSRKKGWRMPPNTVKVDRTTKWGNPYVGDGPSDRARIVARFKAYCEQPQQAAFVVAVRAELRGRNLACWCPLDGPCHAEILLALANDAEIGS